MLNEAAILEGAALSWLDAGSTARLILDRGFAILWANKAARRMLQARRGIEDRDGILTLGPNAGPGMLAAEAAKLRGEEVWIQSHALEGDKGAVIVIRLLPGNRPGETLYGLELRWRDEADHIHYAGYRAYFGVTQAEDRVLRQLLKGLTAEKCAANLDISVDTVRSHIRQLYSKMNISSREALFHVMMPFRVQ
ncbi:helix-turn-helix transcriptional regulator [Sphingobium sp.]|uniref:helix-turn-helix transcriptional regulator n=1 Tax=Sphingobium sp. TaxID=1912891 RepID=UPI0028BE3568|nr:helix-turn-helix transcriptional regulator [Sphingobium sp.]